MNKNCVNCKHRCTPPDNPRCCECYLTAEGTFSRWEQVSVDVPSALPPDNRLWHYMDQQNIPVPVRYRIIELAQGKE